MNTLEKNRDMICKNVIRKGNELTFAKVPLTTLAEKYGTPLYLYDEDRIREMCRIYKKAVYNAFGDKGKVLYASKAACFKKLYEIMREEEMGIDVVSSGEIYTAISANYPLSSAYFHSNNKTDKDIEYALNVGVGRFVVDNEEELLAIDCIAKKLDKTANVLLRLTPGIDPHTYEAVATGKVDSKFGSAIETGQAEKITDIALSLKNVKLLGFHCHIGSQVFDSSLYLQASDIMLNFIADIYKTRGYQAQELDIGGGYGVRYVESQPKIDIASNIEQVGQYIKNRVKELNIEMPTILFEPGRSIVADAGLTLYTVGTVKRILGYKTYVSVDGGMADNPRYALYNSPYTILPVIDNGEQTEICSVVGRCCESGDILQENIPIRNNIKRGDYLACLTTGAYHYSMASNYNRLTRPPIVMIKNGEDKLVVKRQTFEDLIALEL